jgi:hypothetical protein
MHTSADKALTPTQISAATRNQAAAWVAQQVSPTAMVSCDPVMCRALKAHGVPAADLRSLAPNTSTLLGSQVVVATADVRKQFGGSLTSGAPVMLASFGSGNARIDVRVIASHGAATYLAQFRADQQLRKSNSSALLTLAHITISPTARGQLAAGMVDSRLMFLLSFLTTAGRLDVVAFGDSGPGATAGMPFRSLTLAGSVADLHSILASLPTAPTTYRPAHTMMMRRGSRSELVIEFSAPSPLGLFDASP